jgi:hypothetical protein
MQHTWPANLPRLIAGSEVSCCSGPDGVYSLLNAVKCLKIIALDSQFWEQVKIIR